MHNHLSKRGKVTTTFTVILLTVTLFASLLPKATAAPSPVEIVSVTPPSGPVGETVQVNGTIDTVNGSYQIFFDEKEVKNGNATGTSVNTTFEVPLSAKGNHNVTLVDVASENRSSANFNVTTSYYVKLEPARIQEGLNTTITVGVDKAGTNRTYTFMINVTDPQLAFYIKTLDVTTNATGSGFNSISYYKDFSAANTNYVGTYNISVIGVDETLAAGNFSVGLTDWLEYGRTETGTRVNIRGAGYKPNESVSVNITFAGTPVTGYPELTLADDDGVVTHFWEIPKNAQLGTYTVTLANETGFQIKPVPDIQNFTVREIIVYCETQNKYDGNPLAGVTVEAKRDKDLINSGKTNETGFVDLRLDFGNYNFTAFWEGEEVGMLENQSVTEDTTLPPIECELAHITIVIKDEDGLPLPFINVAVTSNVTSTSNNTFPVSLRFETDYTGTVANNTFTSPNYTIEAKRYGHLFNMTTIDLFNTTRINITCPSYTMFVNVLDSNGFPLENIQVEVYEWSSELVTGSGTTDAQGNVSLDATFGRYGIKVYNHSVELGRTVVFNETVIDLILDQQFVAIHCKIFNLELSVVVTDYFGQPIPNAIVGVEREFGQEYEKVDSLSTGSDGTVFLPKIGGTYRISIYVVDKLFDINTLYLNEPEIVKFRIDKLVVVGGYPLEITQFLVCISLVIAVVAVAFVLIYRKLRLRKAPEEKEKSL